MEYSREGRFLNIKVDSLYYETIQDFFDALIPSKKVQHLLIQNKDILLDGNPVKRESDIAGLTLSVNLYPEDHETPERTDLQIDIVYEDEILLVVNKPKELLVHSDGNEEMTLTKMVWSHYADTPYIRPLPIHRLDRNTSGLVVYSKSPVFQPILDKMLNEKQIRRYYLAFTEGIMEEGKSVTIDKPIGKDRHNSGRYVVAKNGQKALTKVRSLGCNKKNNYSVLRCALDTGRTHQIRVHLSSIGYPILNDDLYGRPSKLCIRMGLLADYLEFFHPLKEESLSVDSPLPNDLSELYFRAVK